MKLHVVSFKFQPHVLHARRDQILAVPPYAFVEPHGINPVTLREPLDCGYFHAFIKEKEAREYIEQLKTVAEVDTTSISYEEFVPSGERG